MAHSQAGVDGLRVDIKRRGGGLLLVLAGAALLFLIQVKVAQHRTLDALVGGWLGTHGRGRGTSGVVGES